MRMLLAEIGVDTADNEPNVHVWCNAVTCTSYLQPRKGILWPEQSSTPGREAARATDFSDEKARSLSDISAKWFTDITD